MLYNNIVYLKNEQAQVGVRQKDKQAYKNRIQILSYLVSLTQTDRQRKITWIALALFGISGILPWFIAKFPVGHLTISIYDMGAYFFQNPKFPIDLYSNVVYGATIAGWIFSLVFLGVTSAFVRKKLFLCAGLLIIIPSAIWAVTAPYLEIQMVFLSLANQQPINVEQGAGPGMFASIAAGALVLYGYFLLRKH